MSSRLLAPRVVERSRSRVRTSLLLLLGYTHLVNSRSPCTSRMSLETDQDRCLT